MSAPPQPRLSAIPVLLGLFGLLLAATACALLFLPGPRSPLPGLGVASMGVVGMLAFRRILGKARDTEMALEEGERYIEVIADLSRDIHAIIEARSRNFLYLNPAVSDLLGYPQEEFTKGGLSFFASLVHPEDLPAVQAQFGQLLEPPARPLGPGEREPVQEQTFRARDRRGIYRWFKSRMTVFVRNASGQAVELLAVMHDVTEQRSYEAALLEAQKHESLGALARGTLHDLNNTLMGIQGFTEIAMAGPGDPDRLRGNLENIQASLHRASGLCRQMVAYTGQGRPQIALRQLNDAVRESLPAIESMIPQGGQLELDLEEDLPLVNMDPNQVRYALLNLVYNAADAIRISGGEVTIRTRVKQLARSSAPGLEGAHVCLEVRDTGPGKPPEVLDRLYDPMFAAKWPGNGLGLSTVQGIMREHQGGIHTVSAPGCGDTTCLYFPLGGGTPELDLGDEGTPVAGVSGVILLVDDEPTIRSVLRQGLEQAGFKVIEAGDGVEGFGAFVRHRSSISLVLLDLTMPRMGGEEVFEEIHKLAPDLPVVLMSGYSELEATAALAGRGLAGFLSKPCSIRDALAVLRKAMGAGESARTADG
jgi:PAS domain S-box-containing protein